MKCRKCNREKSSLGAWDDQLQEKCVKLEEIIRNTLWMARRYADQRSTYAPSVVNISIQEAQALDIDITQDSTIGGMFARDGMFGVWDTETQRFKDKDR